jgi:aldose 1-epimerase
MPITKKTIASGTRTLDHYTLSNSQGMEVGIMPYGGIITRLTAPDRHGLWDDVVLGYADPLKYLDGNPHYFGAVIGRYANRIARGQFTLDGKQYHLPVNNGPNTLHGGNGFDKRFWTAAPIVEPVALLELHYTSPDGDEGFPGNLAVTVVYSLDNDNSLAVDYTAKTDRKTVVNLTQHSYFNLSGDFRKSILDHELTLRADAFVPIDAVQIPTGRLQPVAHTPFDFRIARPIGQAIAEPDEQLAHGAGYDHCWALSPAPDVALASVYHPGSGRCLELFTTQPGVQFYSGNFIDGTQESKSGGNYQKRSGFCLETQHFPDAPNQLSFPSAELVPGDVYRHRTVFRFSAK